MSEVVTTETQTPTTTSEAPAVAPAAEAATTAAAAADPLDAGTILGGDAEAKADDTAAAPVGAPEKYELTAPEGFTLDPEAIALADPVFRELNLDNDQANKLIPVAAQFAERIQQQVADATNKAILADVVSTRKAWADATIADPEIGGAHQAEATATAAKALDRFFTPAFRAFLNETGLGNHPEMIRGMYRAGKAISEDGSFERSNAAPQTKVDRVDKFYPGLKQMTT